MGKLFFICLLTCFIAKGQDLGSLFSTTGAKEQDKVLAYQKVEIFIKSNPISRQTGTAQLKNIFNGLQRKFLKKYEAHSDFDAIFNSGRYDCLTATALFAHVLHELDYSFDIIETNYHIFLVVHASTGEVMMETTDRFGGFITDPKIIQGRLEEYRKNLPPENHPAGFLFQYSFNLFQKISVDNLAGLLYFNQAVKAFNREDWLSCSSLLEKSNELYNSKRCDALGNLLINTLSINAVDEKTKASCLARLRFFWIKKSLVVAG